MAELTVHSPVGMLQGVGPAREKALAEMGLFSIRDLLEYFPRDYEDRTPNEAGIAGLPEEEPVCFEAVVAEPFRTSYIRKGMELTKGTVVDNTGRVEVTFFNQNYLRSVLREGETFLFYGKLTGAGQRRRMASPVVERPGEHKMLGGITPIYPLHAGITAAILVKMQKQAAVCLPQVEDGLPEEIRSKYGFPELREALHTVHFPSSWETLAAARQRLMFEELFCLNLGLGLMRGRRDTSAAVPFLRGEVSDFVRTLPFTLTGAQRRAMEEAAADMRHSVPMNRLLQGDVGSGKTVVAAACAALCRENGCQAALMAPTELLAQQHYRTMQTLLEPAGVRVGLLTGSMTAAQKRHCREMLRTGAFDLIVGTHALLSEGVEFSALGLVITDEQHRFGVQQRAALSAKSGQGTHPHVLVMSATPIPRTLALMIYGELDLSVLDELPPGRSPVLTYLVGEDKRQRLNGFVRKQVELGRQVYIVCSAVSDEEGERKAAEQFGSALRDEVFPDLKVGIVHGRMKAKDKQKVMESFSEGSLQILVSTTVIEVGVDVPNASLMIIENADRFGLSQLHQLRGRVGRGPFQSYCVLVSASRSESTRKRLKTLTGTNDGFKIAEEDLKQRGPGDFFGARQHGLPQMKMAAAEGDMRILKQAQQEAAELLQRDPELALPGHERLRIRVEDLFRSASDSFN